MIGMIDMLDEDMVFRKLVWATLDLEEENWLRGLLLTREREAREGLVI